MQNIKSGQYLTVLELPARIIFGNFGKKCRLLRKYLTKNLLGKIVESFENVGPGSLYFISVRVK